MGMLVIAVMGLVINLISMQMLRAGSEKSLNMKGAYLEAWSDMLSSLGVIAAAIVIRFTGWNWVDSVVAAGIGLWVLPRTWILLKESINILLQGVPRDIDLEVIESALRGIEGVNDIHNLHVWSLTSGKHVLSVHVVADLSTRTDQEILAEVDRTVRGFEITHTTIQVEADGFHAQGLAELDHDSGHVHRHDH